jgi:hypothetical protein
MEMKKIEIQDEDKNRIEIIRYKTRSEEGERELAKTQETTTPSSSPKRLSETPHRLLPRRAEISNPKPKLIRRLLSLESEETNLPILELIGWFVEHSPDYVLNEFILYEQDIAVQEAQAKNPYLSKPEIEAIRSQAESKVIQEYYDELVAVHRMMKGKRVWKMNPFVERKWMKKFYCIVKGHFLEVYEYLYNECTMNPLVEETCTLIRLVMGEKAKCWIRGYPNKVGDPQEGIIMIDFKEAAKRLKMSEANLRVWLKYFVSLGIVKPLKRIGRGGLTIYSIGEWKGTPTSIPGELGFKFIPYFKKSPEIQEKLREIKPSWRN